MTNEPTVNLDAYTDQYLVLRALKKELDTLTAEFERRKAEFQKLVGQHHVAEIGGREVFTHRPINSFQGKQFSADHPVLAAQYTKVVPKPQLDVEALAAEHPTVYKQYQSRQFRILEVE